MNETRAYVVIFPQIKESLDCLVKLEAKCLSYRHELSQCCINVQKNAQYLNEQLIHCFLNRAICDIHVLIQVFL